MGVYKVKHRGLRLRVKKAEVSKGLASRGSGLRLRVRGFGYMFCVRRVRVTILDDGLLG